MRRQLQSLCYFLCAISVVGGMADIVLQLYEGSEVLRWRLTIILIGVGVGLPIILFPLHVPSEAEDLNYDENDLSSVYQNDSSTLSSLAPDLDSGVSGDDGSLDGGRDGGD
ncbi:hypothetical protein [uncultured Pseudoteredinibacter sp.]|uniref:hypothetical protein n=1 Tax=uncultured Pseudoteredinibacter sp. TaxID=1641701 RepID=UPI00262B9ECC|nr:hypothetical protein [uncultured Pseudoteredinibacter sp.]